MRVIESTHERRPLIVGHGQPKGSSAPLGFLLYAVFYIQVNLMSSSTHTNVATTLSEPGLANTLP